jgi:activating signal cointegrator complex subunit 2
MAQLPAFVPFPPATIRLQIAPDEWQLCIDAWIALAEAYLRASDPVFNSIVEASDSSVIQFVKSLVHEQSESPNESLLRSRISVTLYRLVYLLTRRILLLPKATQSLLNWSFLSEFAQIFCKVSDIEVLLDQVWQKHSSYIEGTLHQLKEQTIQRIDSHISDDWTPKLRLTIQFIRLCPPAGIYFATGSDLLDSLASAYPNIPPEAQQTITVFTYFVLLSLVNPSKPNFSSLSDHLFFLKSNAKTSRQSKQPSLLSSLVSNTNIVKQLHKMSESDSESSGPVAHRDLAAGLLEFRTNRSWPRHKQKGKGRMVTDANEAVEAVHIHRMSLITQVQDLFPDLGSGFIAKLLDEYNEDVELVTSHLLDDSLPPYLADADRSETLQHDSNVFSATEHIDHIPESPTQLPTRQNVFDGDDLDDLAVDASKVHIGKAHADLTADELLSKGAGSHKAAILAALAKFDSDDDEHNDTYDATDVGGTVDTSADTEAVAENSATTADPDLILHRAWKSDKAIFGRDYGTRRSLARVRLRQESGWTDEAIEGWATMLSRDPKRVNALEKRYADDWKGEQNTIARTSWRSSGHEYDEDDAEPEMGRGEFHGRGRGGIRGGFVASSSEKDTQRARQRKEVRGGGGHNRREQRAKKIARGMS